MAIVKTATIPDSNILLDVIQRQPLWFEWSARQLQNSRELGSLVVNTLVFAETSAQIDSFEEVQRIFSLIGINQEEIPWEAAYIAGRTHQAYRKAGGTRERTLPDFLIGAHAAARGYRIITRDQARYRTYFSSLEIIAPDTHP